MATLPEEITGVLVFDGNPTKGAVKRQSFAGVSVVATTGPRGPLGPAGAPGFVLVEPGEDPPVDTPDRTFVFERV